MHGIMDYIVIFVIIIMILGSINYLYKSIWMIHNTTDYKIENYQGALQSLYSNHGIQDTYLTSDHGPGNRDPYEYWRGIAWDLPTRNLDEVIFYPYPYLYENYVDRYARLWPYW
jgi:hypothetical protein